ncbi:MAG: hypothetical protein ACTSYC_08845 [Promethearchaeota archaeon]
MLKKRKKKVDLRKRRKQLIKEKEKQLPTKEIKKIEEKKEIKEKEDELEIRLRKETRLYWIRAATGVLSAFIGRYLLGFVGWPLFIWMLAFWFLFPFFVSFVIFRYKYDKDTWNWKNIILPGIGIYFFLFMIVGTLIHTLLMFY